MFLQQRLNFDLSTELVWYVGHRKEFQIQTKWEGVLSWNVIKIN